MALTHGRWTTRRHRRKAQDAAGAPGARRGTSLADYAIPRRINFIYERALRKFRGDLRLWMRYIEWQRASTQGGAKALSKTLSKALQLHPTSAGLWSYAAAWEFEHNGNPQARALSYSALPGINSNGSSVWVQF